MYYDQNAAFGTTCSTVKTPRGLRRSEKITILKKALSLLNQKGWTKNYEAVDKDGNEVDPRSREAVSFCAQGAVVGATPCQRYQQELIDTLEANLTESSNAYDLPDFNDNRNRRKRDIIRLYERTISNLENGVEPGSENDVE